METIIQQKPGKGKTADDKVIRIRKKTVSTSINESGLSAELKNYEHGNEKLAR